jgi:hypothetical protein
MKRKKLWTVVVLAVIVTSGIMIVSAMERFKAKGVKPSQIENRPQLPQNYPHPPENATIIPELGSIPFDLSLDTPEIMLSKDQSLDLTVTIYSDEKVDLFLMVLTEDDVPTLVSEHKLLPGVTTRFDRTEITVESEVTVNLTISIGNQATSGTFALQIFASDGGHVVGVPLQLTIP